jgi:hypothetical protein
MDCRAGGHVEDPHPMSIKAMPATLIVAAVLFAAIGVLTFLRLFVW